MAVNLSIKNVPDDLAGRLRQRALRNRRSLQKELLDILAAAVHGGGASIPLAPPAGTLTLDDIAERARRLFPEGTESSVAFIRQMRDERSA